MAPNFHRHLNGPNSQRWFGLHKKSMSCPCARSLLDLSYCMHLLTYILCQLILVHGQKMNHSFEINHHCELGPLSSDLK